VSKIPDFLNITAVSRSVTYGPRPAVTEFSHFAESGNETVNYSLSFSA